MIKARHTYIFDWFFKHYSRIMIRRHFSKIVIKNIPEIKDQSILLIGNHFSWWDGFIAKYINDTFFKKVFHVMMLEEELKERSFLSKAGAFSIYKQSKSMVESLNYSLELLKNNNNLVTMYPQGKFQSIYHQPILFEKGMLRYLTNRQPDMQIICYVALVDYFEQVKPILTIAFLKLEKAHANSPEDIEKQYNIFYNQLVAEQKQQ